ncbi:MAG: DUF1800 family protein [Myxococcota bacterium]
MRVSLTPGFALILTACASGPAPEAPGRPDAGAPPENTIDGAFATEASTARLLTQATFGPRPADVEALLGTRASAWFRTQLETPPSLLLPQLDAAEERYDERVEANPDSVLEVFLYEATTLAFWHNALRGEDQLRQRMAWALSQLFVVSNGGGEVLSDVPAAVASFQDGLIRGAFGNFRDLLTHVTYAPAMGYYLTFLGSQKADPATGRQPDENYARELLQLFTIGVLELGADGEPVVREGRAETYTNADITGLARVFTGFHLDVTDVEVDPRAVRADPQDFGELWRLPLRIYPNRHSAEAKSFLGTTIPAGTPGDESVRLALDAIFAHPNVAPFIGRQLIQRLVTTAPSPAYVARVAAAFDAGAVRLPDGSSVGSGRRGDLAATLAAVLFDDAARSAEGLADLAFGKVREPMLRYAAFVRAFVPERNLAPQYEYALYDTAGPSALAQHPYRARSVFNFYRPGYLAPGTESGAAGLTAPELQLVNATTIPGYANFVFQAASKEQGDFDDEDRELLTAEEREAALRAMVPDYAAEIALADDPAALLAHLDLRLTYGAMPEERRAALAALVARLDAGDDLARVHLAVWLVLTSPEFLVQR